MKAELAPEVVSGSNSAILSMDSLMSLEMSVHYYAGGLEPLEILYLFDSIGYVPASGGGDTTSRVLTRVRLY